VLYLLGICHCHSLLILIFDLLELYEEVLLDGDFLLGLEVVYFFTFLVSTFDSCFLDLVTCFACLLLDLLLDDSDDEDLD